jgi:hypothetical protein
MSMLLTEHCEEIQILMEASPENPKVKDYYISGKFMQAEVQNRNGRIYPMDVMINGITQYDEIYVKKRRAIGELGHPTGPTVNYERSSHIIKSLEMDGNDVIGKAKIMDTPYGKIAKVLMDEGSVLGVSSRALGSVKEKGGISYVQNDFKLAAIDIVADPSGPECFVDSIMEGADWTQSLDPELLESVRHSIRKTVKHELSSKKIELFDNFMNNFK